jgi:dolichyl-phosphate-mannose--protein O-mannosyl transferase
MVHVLFNQYRKEIPCNSIIRLQHAGTNKFLHSHQHSSPLSNQYEISAFEGLDSGMCVYNIQLYK